MRRTQLKMPGELSEYSAETVQNLIQCATDPIFFILNFCKITHPARGIVPFELYEFQREMVESFAFNHNTIVCASRQVGKSQTSCAFLLWYAIFHKNKEILIVSNKAKNAKDMVNRIVFMYENLPNWIKPAINPTNWNKLEISFENGSRIVSESTTVNSGRGMAISLLFCDEFAFINPTIAEEFWTSIRPTLSTGGKSIIASTPNGDDNLYAELWRGASAGTNAFNALFVPWDSVPGRDDEFRKKEIAIIGPEKFAQEYECEFISNDPLLFSSRYVITYKTEALPEPDARGVVWFDTINSNKTYLIAVDPATGSGSDYTVIVLYNFPDLQQIAEFRSNVMSSPLAYNIIKYMLKLLQSKGVENVYWSLENNGVGEGMLSLQSIDENPVEIGELLSDKGKRRLGFNTGKNKLTLCITFKQMFESGRIKIKSKNTINEMKNFIRKNGSYSARSGSTDDTISAHLILMRMLDELVRYEDDAYALMYESDFINEFNDDANYIEPTPIVTSSGDSEMDVWSWYENHR